MSFEHDMFSNKWSLTCGNRNFIFANFAFSHLVCIWTGMPLQTVLRAGGGGCLRYPEIIEALYARDAGVGMDISRSAAQLLSNKPPPGPNVKRRALVNCAPAPQDKVLETGAPSSSATGAAG